ncbi:CDP-alcohol phosphatidyltransferase family protein [Hyperthermus butylicus]|uniref:Phosphatidylglycerophosphate synthase n=1 Tax=Hyperthermus butylicus (strain DSM 5456 / JCM 9403 / PLM1-5) TaxID=415426 RepID=A2BJ62_HYPBU|nr:CDP-alcohol phosphatidyltransferase family protein [Hyperthermus butylicus]ABM80023.1 phosphatidylglycerophosphate synthase [Hyperthermus butylicus DSM 5456]
MSKSGSAVSFAKPTDGIISRTINRKISARITMWLASWRRPPSPDTVSVIAGVMVAAGGLGFAAGYPWLGGILAQLGSILDGVDGEIARVLGRQSKAGALFDTVLDRLADIVLLLGMVLAVAETLDPILAVTVALAAITGDLMVSYIHAFGEKVAGRHPVLIGRIPGIASRDVRLFTVFIAGLLGRPLEGLITVALLGHTYTVAKTVELIKYLDQGGRPR